MRVCARVSLCVRVCVCVCVCACARVCVRESVCALARARVRACVRACVCVRASIFFDLCCLLLFLSTVRSISHLSVPFPSFPSFPTRAQMAEYWTNFAWSGNPNQGQAGKSNLPTWPKFDPTTNNYLNLVRLSRQKRVDRERCRGMSRERGRERERECVCVRE